MWLFVGRVVSVLLLLPASSLAGDILASSVVHDGNTYFLSITARIDAPIDRVYRSITDFDNLGAINPDIEESNVLATPVPGTQRVYSVTRVCILVFCKRVVQVQDVILADDYLIEAVMLPEFSDFHSGFARVQLIEHTASTELLFTHTFEPDFWIPPVIGSWLIKRTLVREVTVTATHIEVKADVTQPQ